MYVYNMRDRFTPMPSQGEVGGQKIFACLSTYVLFMEQPVVS